MIQPRQCYVCGDELIPIPSGHQGGLLPKHDTGDHVPPKGIFNDPKPSNLISVPCCSECNNKHSGFDDQLRMLTASEIGSNEGGKRILEEKFFGSTMAKERQGRFLMEMLRTTQDAVLRTAAGRQLVTTFTVPADLVLPGVQNIVKGLLTENYPAYQYRNDHFEVLNINTATLAMGETERQLTLVGEIISKTKCETKGNFNEFRFWHQVEADQQRGVWLLMFYEAFVFLVWHHQSIRTEKHST